MKVVVQSRIRDYIKQNGIKQSYIASSTGIDGAALSNILTNRRELRADEFELICKALNREPGFFLKIE